MTTTQLRHKIIPPCTIEGVVTFVWLALLGQFKERYTILSLSCWDRLAKWIYLIKIDLSYLPDKISWNWVTCFGLLGWVSLVRFAGLGVDWPGLLGLGYLIRFDGKGLLYWVSLSGFTWSDLLGWVCRGGLICTVCEGNKNKFW